MSSHLKVAGGKYLQKLNLKLPLQMEKFVQFMKYVILNFIYISVDRELIKTSSKLLIF